MSPHTDTSTRNSVPALTPLSVILHMSSFSDTEVKEWGERSDVLYHFHAYRYFSKAFPDTSVDLVNLEDADVQFYNRCNHMTHGLNNPEKLVKYLLELTSKYPAANTLRKRFILHVRDYNSTRVSRRRFYMTALTAGEVEFLAGLPVPSLLKSKSSVEEASIADSDVGSDGGGYDEVIASVDVKKDGSEKGNTFKFQHFNFATDGCPKDTHSQAHEELKQQEDTFAALMGKCLEEAQDTLASNEVSGLEAVDAMEV